VKQKIETELDAIEQSDLIKSARNTLRGRSPRRPAAPGNGKENSFYSLATEGESNPQSQGFFGIDSERSFVKDEFRESASHLTLLKGRRFSRGPQGKILNVTNKMEMVDIKELLYYSNLEPFRGKDDLLWDGVYNLKFLNTLRGGSIFGEMALTTGKKRSATIIAMEDCVFGVLHKEEFKRILHNEKNSLKQTLEFFYRVFPINLSQLSMTKLSRMFIEEKLKFKQVLFHEGDVADGFYIIKSGEVLVNLLARSCP